jgi:hypothetical protein
MRGRREVDMMRLLLSRSGMDAGLVCMTDPARRM